VADPSAMCRLMLYLGPETRLSSLIVEPKHSLIRQSVHSEEREEPLNGDGFGIGWYASEHSAEPAVFRSITPAWNNRNLQNLARVVASECVLAHVRAATQSSGVNEANCHPFRWRQYLCMHNGDVGDFRLVRRKLLASVCDEAFGNVYGSTDSEHFFALFIDSLLGFDEPDPALRMARALACAIRRALALVQSEGAGGDSYLNIAISETARRSSSTPARAVHWIMVPVSSPIAAVAAIASAPQKATRAAAIPSGAPPARAAIAPNVANATSAAAGIAKRRRLPGASMATASGSTAPHAKLAAEAAAACSGRAIESSVMPSSSRA
jgi:glutamine amidotransferase